MRNIKVIPDLPFKVNEFQDITDTLPSKPDPETMRTVDEITHASVHHSAVEGATIQSYANYHVNTLGWAHIGYHNVIKGDTLFQTNDWLTMSYHTSSHNRNTISFSISGDLSKRPPTEIERQLLYAGLLTALSVFPNLTIENIWGHNEFPDNKTSCPCINMDQVRKDVRTIQNQMEYAKSDDNAKAVAFKIANQIIFMANMLTGKMADGTEATEGNKVWARESLLALEPFMKERRLLL